jgi:hypothetical protein
MNSGRNHYSHPPSYNVPGNMRKEQGYSRQLPRQQMVARQRSQQRPQLQEGLPFQIGAEGQYILYYSNYCINCKEFMTILCKTPIYSNFTKINVSGNVSYPNFVKSVPTIIVPKVQRPLVGEEVFKWLEEQSVERVKNENQGIIPYSPGEMGSGLTDNYSYLDAKDTEQPMEHTFSFIKRSDQKIETPPEDSFVNTKQKPVQPVSRQPFPQNPQRQTPFETPPSEPRPSQGVGAKPPMIPLSSGGDDGKNVEEAYNELLARRKMDLTSQNRQ